MAFVVLGTTLLPESATACRPSDRNGCYADNLIHVGRFPGKIGRVATMPLTMPHKGEGRALEINPKRMDDVSPDLKGKPFGTMKFCLWYLPS